MATKTSNIGLETSHFNNFKEYIPNFDSWCADTTEKQLDLGLIQISTAFEHALANVGGHQVVSEDECDLSDGSDAKLSSVRVRGLGRAYSAHVAGSKTKTGKLRVQVYERKHHKFYYFVIPWNKHCAVKYLEIPFKLDGTPQRSNHWWNHEVKTFERLAKD